LPAQFFKFSLTVQSNQNWFAFICFGYTKWFWKVSQLTPKLTKKTENTVTWFFYVDSISVVAFYL